MRDAQVHAALIDKYDRPGPRYTSYPTAPVWTEQVNGQRWARALESHGTRGPFALYLHLPFCERKCLYCGCTMTVTRRQSHIDAYLDALEREVTLTMQHLGGVPEVTQMHWGGGTPNYLSSAQLARAFGLFASRVRFRHDVELSIEADPRQSSLSQLQQLRALGFNRISFGVQDLNESVQLAIGRVQPMSVVQKAVDDSRSAGFSALNVDVMYGLPHQTPARFAQTLRHVQSLKPDRVACFGYAHVPWMRPHQRAIETQALPGTHERFALLQMAVELFTSSDYGWIGLDHFAAHDDALTVAQQQRRLHRNFMGYTTMPAERLLAFGMSAISDLGRTVAQNATTIDAWREAIDRGEFPVTRGHDLTDDDVVRQRIIMELMCNLECDLPPEVLITAREALEGLADDGLVRTNGTRLTVTPSGRYFLRNICMAFDAHLAGAPGSARYSRAI